MKILNVSVTGYKSVQEETVLFLRDNLTCFIGANEHGKTNLMKPLPRPYGRGFSFSNAEQRLP